MSKRTVKLKRYLKIVNEYEADGTITPGDLLELKDNGKVQRHSEQDKNALPMFALEDELQGKSIGNDYSAEDPVQCWIPTRGDEVYARLKANEEVVIGDFLVSNGDGTLRKHREGVHSATDDRYPLKIVGQALEAVNETSVERIAIRVV